MRQGVSFKGWTLCGIVKELRCRSKHDYKIEVVFQKGETIEALCIDGRTGSRNGIFEIRRPGESETYSVWGEHIRTYEELFEQEDEGVFGFYFGEPLAESD